MYGPYGPDARGRYRIVKVGHEGGRSSATFRTLKAALAAKAKAQERLTLEGLTVSDVVDRFIAHRVAMGRKEATLERYTHAFRGMLWDVFDAPVAALTKKRAQKLYDARREAVRSTTQLNELNQVKTLFRFAVKKALLKASPFEDIEPIGSKECGKDQLTLDESRIFTDYCLTRVPDVGAIGALCALGLGLRAGEICNIEPRDIDDDGQVLVIRKEIAKNKKGRRIFIPEWLRHIINKETLPLGLSKMGLLTRVKTLCRRAGVTEVTTHGLRGTASSLADMAGMAGVAIAMTLGHSEEMNRRHYSKAGAVSSGMAARVAALRLVK